MDMQQLYQPAGTLTTLAHLLLVVSIRHMKEVCSRTMRERRPFTEVWPVQTVAVAKAKSNLLVCSTVGWLPNWNDG